MTKLEGTNDENHVLMVALASQGHINPMLRLGKRLLRKGLHVTLVTTENARQQILSSATAATDTVSGIGLMFISDSFSLDYNRIGNLDHYMDCLARIGATNLTNLIKESYPIGGNKKLLCLINNPFVHWVANVASELQLPCAIVWIQPCSLFTIYYYHSNKLCQFPTLANPKVGLNLPGLPMLMTEDLPSFVLPSNQFVAISKMIHDMFRNIKNYNWVLANSFFELEKDVIESMQALIYPLGLRPVGPLVPSFLLGEEHDDGIGFEMWEADGSCMDWLDKQEPSSVVYVSFGSVSVLSAKQMEAIALALKAIKYPFLWVVKNPDVPPRDGSGQLPLGFLEETKDLGLVVSWSPQTKVLAHQAVGCFITHCGWNSLSEAISAGLPVIGYPQWTDQPTNVKLIVDVFHIGLRLRPEQDGIVTSEEIELCVREIMYGPRSEELRSNATKLNRLARKAVADGGSSDRNVQWFVDEITKKGSNDALNPNGVVGTEKRKLRDGSVTHPLIR